MKREKLFNEIHSSILLFKDKNIDEHELQIAIESMVDDYHESQLKLLNMQNVSKAEGVSLPSRENLENEAYDYAQKQCDFEINNDANAMSKFDNVMIKYILDKVYGND